MTQHLKFLARGAAFALLAGVAAPAPAGVPIDSFNSANPGLLPSAAIDRDPSRKPVRTGPADALARMAERSRRSTAPLPKPAPPPAQP